jgi:hypothetical protein
MEADVTTALRAAAFTRLRAPANLVCAISAINYVFMFTTTMFSRQHQLCFGAFVGCDIV